MTLKDKLKEVKDKFKQTEEVGSEAQKRMEYARKAAKQKTTQPDQGVRPDQNR